MSTSTRRNGLSESQFAKDVKKASSLIESAKKSIDRINQFIDWNDKDGAVKESFRYEEISEKIVNQARLIPINSGMNMAKREVEKAIIRESGTEISYTSEGWFMVRLPSLLPKKEKGNPTYIRATLAASLKEYFKTNKKRRFTEPCVFIARHNYSKERPEREYRDHDNIELNAVVDTIALYVMVDDSPMRCRHYYCSAVSESDCTEVFIVPSSDFVKWLNIYDGTI